MKDCVKVVRLVVLRLDLILCIANFFFFFSFFFYITWRGSLSHLCNPALWGFFSMKLVVLPVFCRPAVKLPSLVLHPGQAQWGGEGARGTDSCHFVYYYLYLLGTALAWASSSHSQGHQPILLSTAAFGHFVCYSFLLLLFSPFKMQRPASLALLGAVCWTVAAAGSVPRGVGPECELMLSGRHHGSREAPAQPDCS